MGQAAYKGSALKSAHIALRGGTAAILRLAECPPSHSTWPVTQSDRGYALVVCPDRESVTFIASSAFLIIAPARGE